MVGYCDLWNTQEENPLTGRDLCSSGMLRNLDWCLVANVSEQHI